MAAVGMRDDDLTILGRATRAGFTGDVFGVTRADRRRPTLIEGMSGTGKTTLLKNMLVQDIARGEGLCVIDPLGVFADELLDLIPAARLQDVTYFNPADAGFPIGYNVLGGYAAHERDRAAASVVSVFNAIWNLSLQNPTIHSILGNGIAALMESKNATLLWLPRFLTDDDWRAGLCERLANPTVRAFLQDFGRRPRRERRVDIQPVLNRVQELFRDPVMANIFGQERKAIDIPRHLAERRILIVNLARAKIGSENASLIGAFIVSDIANAAYARIEAVAQEERLAREQHASPVFTTPDFYLYIDEFQDMAGAARFDELFSQSRNGRLSLTCLFQFQGLLPERVRAAAFGNAGTLLSFQVGADDAEKLERAFGGEIKAHELTALGRYEIAVKLPAAPGRTGLPFHGVTLPATGRRHGYRAAIIERARRQYGRPKEKAERAIAHFLASPEMQAKARRMREITRTMKQKPTTPADSPGTRLRRVIDQAKARAGPDRLPGSSTASQTDRTDQASRNS